VSDRLELLRQMPGWKKAQALAAQRLLTGECLIERSPKAEGLSAQAIGEIKLALMIVHDLNPWERLGAEEEALFRGVSTDTVQRHRKELKQL
jgi:hypothetical protein